MLVVSPVKEIFVSLWSAPNIGKALLTASSKLLKRRFAECRFMRHLLAGRFITNAINWNPFVHLFGTIAWW